MANFAAALKDEVRRLAAKAVRGAGKLATGALRTQRRELVSLKRQQALLEKKFTALVNAQNKLAAKASKNGIAAPVVKPMRFSPKWLSKHREKTKLSAEQYAKLAGVSAQSIYHWESGKSKPRVSQLHTLSIVRTLGHREALRKLEELTGKKARAGRRARRKTKAAK